VSQPRRRRNTFACLIFVAVVEAGCQQPYGRWIYQETPIVNPCPGGRINQVKRTTDTHLGRVRQTVVNTDSCLE
jgi:hypothetical protein